MYHIKIVLNYVMGSKIVFEFWEWGYTIFDITLCSWVFIFLVVKVRHSVAVYGQNDFVVSSFVAGIYQMIFCRSKIRNFVAEILQDDFIVDEKSQQLGKSINRIRQPVHKILIHYRIKRKPHFFFRFQWNFNSIALPDFTIFW